MKNLVLAFVLNFVLVRFYTQEKPREISLDLNGVEATMQLDVSQKERKVHLDEVYFWYKTNRVVQTVGGYQGQLLNGYYIESYPKGQLKLKGFFCLGQQCGEWKYWNEEGKLQRVENWKNNQLHGTVFYFDSEGVIQKKVVFKKGKEIK